MIILRQSKLCLADNETLTFDYTIEDKSPLLYICCKDRETGTIINVWANKATGNIYLFGPDIDGTGRNVVLSYHKQ